MQELYLPEKIKVGYQARNNTYTKRLAYVIYYDHKGVLRKETSWQSWRDKNIPDDEFENVPTSGFVLNRPVGGVKESYGWNTRNSYIRVYDPRGFEIEITLENLLFILEVYDSIKGKGLIGEFVYGWAGTELVLLPTETTDYKASIENTIRKSCDLKLKELVVGKTYEFKDGKKGVYLGNMSLLKPYVSYNWTSDAENWKYSRLGNLHNFEKSTDNFPYKAYVRGSFDKGHLFFDINKNEYFDIKSNSSLSRVHDEEGFPTLAELYSNLYNTMGSIKFDSIEETKDFDFFTKYLKSKVIGQTYSGSSDNKNEITYKQSFSLYEKIDDNTYYVNELTLKPYFKENTHHNFYHWHRYTTFVVSDIESYIVERKLIISFNDDNYVTVKNVGKKESLISGYSSFNEIENKYSNLVFGKNDKKIYIIV